MRKGKVIEIHPERGYGFVKEQTTGLFFHFNTSDLFDHIAENEIVVFSLIELDPGKLAINLRRTIAEQQNASQY
jgi:cold shock CspA family protein